MMYYWWILSFAAEMLIISYYCNSKFKAKVNKLTLISSYSACAVFAFVAGIVGIEQVNNILFALICFFMLCFCYETNLKQKVIHTLIPSFGIFLSDFAVNQAYRLFFTDESSFFNDIPIFAHYHIFFSAPKLMLLFFMLLIASKFSIQNRHIKIERFSLPLCILPVTSVVWMILSYHAFSTDELINQNNAGMYIFYICNMLILFANIIVFYFHEQTIRTNEKYTELALTRQRERNSADYYDLLKQQNENARILIHDIKKHLSSAEMLKSNEYINSVIDEFKVNKTVSYCNNTLLNLITYRYSRLCENKGIKLDVNIQNAQLGFMNEPDITALFDNLLENAVEAAAKSEGRFINFSIDIRNTNFMVINLSNSCDKKPLILNNRFISSKPDSALHGIGIKSIKRIVKKYGGYMDMSFSDNEKSFSSVITFQLNGVNR